MKWLRISLGVLALLLLLVGLTVVIITQWVDPNQYKPQITELIEQNLGRQLAIKGDIQFSFFPWLGLKLGNTILNNPDDFQQQPFAAIQQAQLKVKLLPLFSQQIEIGQIKIDNLQLLLIQRADGSNNWQDLAQTAETENTANDSDNSRESQQNIYLKNLKIEGLSLNNSSIAFIDEKLQTSYVLKNTNLETSAITLDQIIQIKLESSINASQLKHSAKIKLQTAIMPNIDQQIIQFENLQLVINSKLLPDDLQFNLATGNLNLNQQQLNIPKLVIQTPKIRINAQLNVSDILSIPTLTAKINVQQTQLDELLKKYNISFPIKSAKIDFDLHATSNNILLNQIQAQFDQYPIHIPEAKINLIKQQLEIGKLYLTLLDAKLELKRLKLENFAQPTYSSQLKLTNFNLKKWLAILKLPDQKTADKKALTQLDLNTDISGDLEQIQLKNLAIILDETQIKGQVTINHFANPIISLRLEADTLDADRYMPPANPNQKPTQPLLPLELLKALNVKGHIKLRKLTITQMQLQDINLQFID